MDIIMTTYADPIGIYGGTFDPIHFGHLRSAEEVLAICQLQQIYFIPCKTPVHKKDAVATEHDRLAMLMLATEQVLHLTISDIEIKRNTPSYTIDTLKEFNNQFKDTPLCLLLGSDSFMQLPTWHHWKEIIEKCHIIIMKRPGFPLELSTELESFLANHLADDISELHENLSGKIYYQSITEMCISSTQIRAQINAGFSAHYLLPDNVLTYIEQKKLYRNVLTNSQ